MWVLLLMTGRRSGECPSHLTSSCVEQCSSDSDCSHYQTCCHSGCGHTCEISRTHQGSWTNWNQWSSCSVTCGRGTQSRYRQCHSGHCAGERSETRRCNNQECQTQVQYNGRRFGVCPSQNELTSRCMEQCSYDSECSVNQKCCFNGCGKTCEMSTKYQRSWTNWNQWSSCSVTCGRGTRSRRRQCHSGHCSSERSETRQCNNQECQNEVHYNDNVTQNEPNRRKEVVSVCLYDHVRHR
ncbi:Hypothetical predicted protein [Mytilus galloprovincialis]|uniref:WAP domain-containing protein n=1 Tax=Mytilus galloprovincialis TaxID=29158 RepID=A0A8B6BGY6_MYTGA|nr:Hypothetical predicted protein [Mytilus galloprovincialis]